MRRGVLAILGTVAGTGLLVGAKFGTPQPMDAAAAATDPAATATDAPTGTATAGAAAGGKAQAAKAGGGLKDGTFMGTATPAHTYEMVTVSITVANGKITAAKGSCGDATGLSAQLCGGAVPKLQQEALKAQSTKIATVSGATYTSGAYKTSLQSAIDQAKA